MTYGILLALSCLAVQDPVEQKLKSMRLDVSFEEETLESTIDYLRDVTDLNFVIDPELDAEAAVSVRLRDVSVRSILKVILCDLDAVAEVRDGIVNILPSDKAGGVLKTRIYDIRELLVQLREFPGPRLELLAPGDNHPGISVTWGEIETPVVDGDMILTLIEEMVGEGHPDGSVTLTDNHQLVVRQNEEAHDRIARLIAKLRWFK